MYAFHTTMFPRFNPATGMMDRAYLGRRVFIRQLNAAGRHVAMQLGLEIIDYEQIGTRSGGRGRGAGRHVARQLDWR